MHLGLYFLSEVWDASMPGSRKTRAPWDPYVAEYRVAVCIMTWREQRSPPLATISALCPVLSTCLPVCVIGDPEEVGGLAAAPDTKIPREGHHPFSDRPYHQPGHLPFKTLWQLIWEAGGCLVICPLLFETYANKEKPRAGQRERKIKERLYGFSNFLPALHKNWSRCSPSPLHQELSPIRKDNQGICV